MTGAVQSSQTHVYDSWNMRKLTRRSFLTTALALPVGASLAHYEALAAPAQGEVKITAIKTIRLNNKSRGNSRALIKVETDAGLAGYGPSEGGPEARAAIAALEGATGRSQG